MGGSDIVSAESCGWRELVNLWYNRGAEDGWLRVRGAQPLFITSHPQQMANSMNGGCVLYGSGE